VSHGRGGDLGIIPQVTRQHSPYFYGLIMDIRFPPRLSPLSAAPEACMLIDCTLQAGFGSYS
jgi:hypothetical protein